MQIISFRNTALFKRGIWLSVAALLVFAVTPSLLDGTLLRQPGSSLFAVGILSAFCVYFAWKTQFHRLADEVIDGETCLMVRRGRTQETVPFANIAVAEVSGGSGLNRITLRLLAPTKLGKQIEFLPQASLWSNPSAMKSLAVSLMERANRAQQRALS